MAKKQIEALLSAALKELAQAEQINFRLDIPPRLDLGDYASNAAIVYAKKARRNPMEIAEQLAKAIKSLDSQAMLANIQIAKPGFINFFLSADYLNKCLPEIAQADHNWGKSGLGAGHRILLEFVSANPTGPLHVGHGRWAVIGDVIGNLLKAVGYRVDKEFYVNNIGNQVDKLWLSILAARNSTPIPEGGYGGAYVKEIQGQTLAEALAFVLQQQQTTLESLGIKFDRFFFENELHQSNKVRLAVEKLGEIGKTFEEEGAIWFKSQELGDDKNRVLIRNDGQPTYFSADIAYHLDKFARGYDYLINIWGTDHHGYVNRLKSALKVLGQPVERFEIIIGQLVTLYRGDEPIRMSKRTGELVTLQEVIDETGADATRFFFSATDVNSHLDFDLELAKKQTSENPVYYVQYAHARICSILRKATAEKLDQNPQDSDLSQPAERELILKLLSFPDVVEVAALMRHPHKLTEFGKELAVCFHHFYEKCRVIGYPARINLANSSRIVLRNVLELLGISAPESM